MRAHVLAGPLLTVLLLATVSCGANGDGGSGGNDPDGTSGSNGEDTPASLIPSVTQTSPTTGPPSTDPASAALEPSASDCDPGSAGPIAVADDLDLRIQLREALPTGPVHWTMMVVNQGSEVASLVYPSAIDGDVTLSQDGEEQYRWGSDAAGAEVVRCQRLVPGQEYRFELDGDLDVTPGDYDLVASLAAEPAPAPARVSVTVVDADGN